MDMLKYLINELPNYDIQDITNNCSIKKISENNKVLIKNPKKIYYLNILKNKTMSEQEKIKIGKNQPYVIFHKDNYFYFGEDYIKCFSIRGIKNFLSNGVNKEVQCIICNKCYDVEKTRKFLNSTKDICIECFNHQIESIKFNDNIPTKIHHYIPKFIIRNFAHDDHHKKHKDKKFIKTLDINENKRKICEIRTIYGIKNMYKDIKNFDDMEYIEKELSKLECKSKIIIQLIIDSKNEITILRKHLLSLKIFLFVMSFRSERTLDIFMKENIFSDNENPEYMRKYINESGKNIWLNDLKQILSTPDFMKIIQYSDIYKALYSIKEIEDEEINTNVSKITADINSILLFF